MDTSTFMTQEREAIVGATEIALRHTRHYGATPPEELRQRIEALFEAVLDAVVRRDLAAVISYAEKIADERFSAGYGLSEVQAAFNALEEAAWELVFEKLQPSEFADALGLISTVLGAAKDALARRYVSLATNRHAPALDMTALFAGSERPPSTH